MNQAVRDWELADQDIVKVFYSTTTREKENAKRSSRGSGRAPPEVNVSEAAIG
jgi:hypothetical protein